MQEVVCHKLCTTSALNWRIEETHVDIGRDSRFVTEI